MEWLRKIWPSSLYGQLLWVVALALLAAQAANTALLIASTKARAEVEASSMLVARVASQFERQRINGDRSRQGRSARRNRRFATILMISTNEPTSVASFDRHEELSERAAEYLTAINPDIEYVSMSRGPVNGLPDTLRSSVIERSRNARFERMGNGKVRDAVLLTLRNGDGKWISAAAYVRPLSGWPFLTLLAQTIVLYLAVLIPLALIARRISRPLRILTHRVQSSGLTGGETPLVPQGPSDVRNLIQALNNAGERLTAMLTEKDVMLGAIGHDLKTPLASLRVRIESVDDDAEREKMAATVNEMAAILDDILMLARLGKTSEQLQTTELGALIESIVDELPDDGRVTFVGTGQRCVAAVKPVLIKRAIRNLIDNALQYGGNARISLKDGQGEISFVIDDDGPGIPPEQIAEMFQPFVRAEHSRNRQSGGTGLGLTIARAIAQAHGGTLTLQNRTEGGLGAHLTLPVSR